MTSLRSVIVPVVASVVTLIVLISFFVAGFLVRGWWDETQGPAAIASSSGLGELFVDGVSADDDPFWGPQDALVTVVEFAALQETVEAESVRR